jgi:hypothetical protein
MCDSSNNTCSRTVDREDKRWAGEKRVIIAEVIETTSDCINGVGYSNMATMCKM